MRHTAYPVPEHKADHLTEMPPATYLYYYLARKKMMLQPEDWAEESPLHIGVHTKVQKPGIINSKYTMLQPLGSEITLIPDI